MNRIIRRVVYSAKNNKSKKKMLLEIEQIIDETMNEMGMDQHSFHLDGDRRAFTQKLENTFKERGIDLSYDSAVLPNLGFKVGGNAGGISGDILFRLWELSWHKVNMTKDEIIEHIKKNPNIRFFREVKCGPYSPLEEIDKNEIINKAYGSTWENHGVGSQQSVHNKVVELYMDDEGNLMIDSYTEIYD